MHENPKTSMTHTVSSERTCRLPACIYIRLTDDDHTAYTFLASLVHHAKTEQKFIKELKRKKVYRTETCGYNSNTLVQKNVSYIMLHVII